MQKTTLRLHKLNSKLGQLVEFSGSPIRDYRVAQAESEDRLNRRTVRKETGIAGALTGAASGALALKVLSRGRGSTTRTKIALIGGGALAGNRIGRYVGARVKRERMDRE